MAPYIFIYKDFFSTLLFTLIKKKKEAERTPVWPEATRSPDRVPSCGLPHSLGAPSLGAIPMPPPPSSVCPSMQLGQTLPAPTKGPASYQKSSPLQATPVRRPKRKPRNKTSTQQRQTQKLTPRPKTIPNQSKKTTNNSQDNMSSSGPRYPTMSGHKYSNIAERQEKTLKPTLWWWCGF